MSFNFKDAKLTWFDQDLQMTSKLTGVFLTTVTATWGAFTANTTVAKTFTLNGLRTISGTGTPPNINPGDIVIVQPQSNMGAGVSLAGSWVSAANTLSIALACGTTTNPGALTFDVLIFKFGQLDGLSA